MKDGGIDILACLLTAREITDLDLAGEADTCRALGLQHLSFPITDRTVPNSFEAVSKFADRLLAELACGKGIGIHCYAGIGRSALIAASVLIKEGKSTAVAFDLIRYARRYEVPQTEEQREWAEEFARFLQGER